MSLRSRIASGSSKREDFPLVINKAALVIIDIQKYLSSPHDDDSADDFFYAEALPGAIEKIGSLLKAFREARDTNDNGGCEVIFCYLQAATNDGRDISWDYKLSGPKLTNIPTQDVPMKDLFLEAVKPDTTTGKGDILLPKTSCSVFMSTNLDYLLKNLGIEQVVFAGQLTDQCVESAVRDAADLGYFVTLAEDACAAKSPEDHQKGIHGATGFARIVQSSQIVDELSSDTVRKAQNDVIPSKSNEPDASAVLAYLETNGLETAAAEMKHFLETGEVKKHLPTQPINNDSKIKVSPEKKKMIASSLVAWAKTVNTTDEKNDTSNMSSERKEELAKLLQTWARSVNGTQSGDAPAYVPDETEKSGDGEDDAAAPSEDLPAEDPGTPKKKKGLFGRLGRGKNKKSEDGEAPLKEEGEHSQSAAAPLGESTVVEEAVVLESTANENIKSKKGWFGRKKADAEESKETESSNVEAAEPSESGGAGSEKDVQESTEVEEPVSPGKKNKSLFGLLKKGLVGSKKVKDENNDGEEIEEAFPDAPEKEEVPTKAPGAAEENVEAPIEPQETPEEPAPEPVKEEQEDPEPVKEEGDPEPQDDVGPEPVKPKKSKKRRDGPEEHPVQEITIDTAEEEEPKKEKKAHKKSKKSEKSDDKKAPKRSKSHKSKSKSDGGSSEEKKKKKRSSKTG